MGVSDPEADLDAYPLLVLSNETVRAAEPDVEGVLSTVKDAETEVVGLADTCGELVPDALFDAETDALDDCAAEIDWLADGERSGDRVMNDVKDGVLDAPAVADTD